MKDDCDLSIIIPIYNAQKNLESCLVSIVEDGGFNFEVILVNDASTDDSEAICRAYVERQPNLYRYIAHDYNLGPGVARNSGINVARGEYLYFLDSDDELYFKSLAKALSEAKKKDCDMVCSGVSIIEGNDYKEYTPDFNSSSALLRSKFFLPSAWAKLYRKKFLDKNKILFSETSLGEDLVFNIKALYSDPSLISVPYKTYLYKKRDSSLTYDLSKRSEILSSLKSLDLFLNKKMIKKDMVYWRIFIIHTIYNPLCLIFIDTLLKGMNRKKNLKFIPSYIKELISYFKNPI